MKKLILLLAAALLLTGCTGKTPEATETSEKDTVVLDLVTCYGVDDGNRKKYEQAIRAYEEQSGNVVWDRSSVSNEDWKNKVLTDFMTDSEPDVLFYFMNADADPFVNAGKVVPIEEIREIYPDYGTNMRQELIPQAKDGNHYAVPSSSYWETMFVNRKVLDACGVSIPGPDYTWEQFLRDCDTIKAKGYVPIACSLSEIPHYWFEFLLLNNGSLDNHLQIPGLQADGSLDMDETAQKWIAGLNDLKELYDKGYFPETTLTSPDVETVAMFAEGQAAFLVDGSWKVSYLETHYGDHLDDYAVSFFPGKGNRQADQVIGGISMGYFITRKAWDNPEKREPAVELVFHMTSEEVLRKFSAADMTALDSNVIPEGMNPLQYSAAAAFSQVRGMITAVQDSMSSDAKRELFDNIQNVVTGRMTPAQAVESAVKLN